jgi:hypothetical protein
MGIYTITNFFGHFGFGDWIPISYPIANKKVDTDVELASGQIWTPPRFLIFWAYFVEFNADSGIF